MDQGTGGRAAVLGRSRVTSPACSCRAFAVEFFRGLSWGSGRDRVIERGWEQGHAWKDAGAGALPSPLPTCPPPRAFPGS